MSEDQDRLKRSGADLKRSGTDLKRSGTDLERSGTDLKRSGTDLKRSGTDLDKRFPLAMLMYAALAALVWFTMDAGKVLVMGRPVEIRWVPLIIIGGLALRTVLARSAERIRRDGEKSSS